MDSHGAVFRRTGTRVRKDAPKISVIIPNYNTAEFIAETLKSVLSQEYKDYEIIVINDAAPDTKALEGVLAPYWEEIIFLDKALTEGTSATRNFAAREARGEIIAFLDADDVWHPTYLQEQIQFLESNSYDMVYAEAELFGESRRAGTTMLPYNPQQGTITRRLLIEGRCHILPSGTLIKKDTLFAVGGFDPNVKRTEDFDLWMRLIFHQARIGYLRKVLFKFRLRPGSGSGDSLQRFERCRDIWHVLQTKLPFTDEENRIIERHIKIEDAAVLRARGRLFINQRDWTSARAALREAQRKATTLGLPLKHRLKLSAVLLVLNVYPTLVLRLFRHLRTDELRHMSVDVLSRTGHSGGRVH